MMKVHDWTITLVSTAFLLSLLLLVPTTTVGNRDYYESCDISALLLREDQARHFQSRDESRKCDARRGLYCHPDIGECRCFIPGLIYRDGKCRAKVQRACGLTNDGYLIDCVKGSFCNATSHICECPRGYLSNEETTACFSSSANQLLVGGEDVVKMLTFVWAGLVLPIFMQKAL